MQIEQKVLIQDGLTVAGESVPKRVIAGVRVAETPLVRHAIEVARVHMEPYLFNHVMRSWLFATLVAEQRSIVHDPEVVAVSAVLHDIGLADSFVGPLRFEVEGANFARGLASGHGLDDRRAQLIWDSIALNSTPSICLHKEPEAAVCLMGVGLDWGGWDYDLVSAEKRKEILSMYPRLGMKKAFTRAVCNLCEQRPDTTYDNFARDFGERFVDGYKAVSFVDALQNAPFEE